MHSTSQRFRNRFTLFGIACILLGVGMNLVLAFAPNIVPPLLAKILMGFGFGFIVLTIVFFVISFLKKPIEAEQKPMPVPPPLDRSVKEKLPDGRTLTFYPPRVILGSPGSEDKMQKVMFKTEAGGEVHIPTSGSPRVLRFLRPHEVTIREEELPKEFPTGDGRIVVKKFTPRGFIIEEISTYNVQVEVEVYLKHEGN